MSRDANPPAPPTPSQTVGPFFGFALPFDGDSDSTHGSSGARLRVEGQLTDGAGAPVPDGLIEIFDGEQFARCRTDTEGVFHFTVLTPRAHEGLAPHFDVMVFARGLLRQLWTRMYLPGPGSIPPSDPVLELVDADRRERLVARDVAGVLRFDLRLQGEGESVFFALPDF